jgi:hypothetical protein
MKQKQIDTLARLSGTTVTAFDEARKQAGVNGLSALCIFPPSIFMLTRDQVEDGMHLLIEGCLRKIVSLTFDKSHAEESWNLRRDQQVFDRFNERLRGLHFPAEFSRYSLYSYFFFATACLSSMTIVMAKPKLICMVCCSNPFNIAEETKKATANELYTFARVAALPCLFGLLSTDAMECWKLLIQLVCGLCHSDVPKDWVNDLGHAGLNNLTHLFISRFEQVYGRVSVNFAQQLVSVRLRSCLTYCCDSVVGSAVQYVTEFSPIAAYKGEFNIHRA